MKSSLVRVLIFTALFLVVGAVIYVFVFLRPNANRIEALEHEIEDARAELVAAQQRDYLRPQLYFDIERLNDELLFEQGAYANMGQVWQDGYQRFLLPFFDDAEMYQRIQRIVTPYGEGLHVDFPYSQPLSMMRYTDPGGLPVGIWMTPVNITFSATYDGLISIMTAFANEGIDNRIIEYSIARQSDRWQVNIRLDVLSQTPPHNRYNGYLVHEDSPGHHVPPSNETDNGNGAHAPGDDYDHYTPDYEYYHYTPGYTPDYNNGAGGNDFLGSDHPLVGPWYFLYEQYYYFNPDGTGVMAGGALPFHWQTSGGILSICLSHEFCSDGTCLAPLEWYYTMEGWSHLTLISRDIPDLVIEYFR